MDDASMMAVAEEYMPAAAVSKFRELLRPAARLDHRELGTNLSHLGGEPVLAEAWPARGRQKLSLVASLYLPEFVGIDVGFRLPSDGWLNFFYDAADQPWGYDGDGQAGCRVIHTPGGRGDVVAAPSSAIRFDHAPVGPSKLLSHPSDLELDAMRLEDRWTDARYDLLDTRLAGPPWPEAMMHQVGGWPRPVQHPLPGTEIGGDRMLLLQLDSDPRAGFMWGDAGLLYFTISHEDLDAGRFDRVSIQLQCC